MNRASDEDLLGFALGGLEPDELERIDALLHDDPALAQRVEQMRRELAPLDALAGPARPRTGLARRTCECIASVPLRSPGTTDPAAISAATGEDADLSFVETKTPWSDPARIREVREAGADGRRRTAVMDVLIVAVVLMLLAAIVLPAVNYSRFQARVTACQGNLQTTGMSLLQFADLNGGTHLTIPSDPKLGFAGYFAPRLLESGFVDDPAMFFCPGVSSNWNDNEQTSPIPTIGTIQSADEMSLVPLQRRAGGDYAYSIGYMVNNQYQPTRKLNRTNYALLADQPSAELPARASHNHGGYGQNVFFEDGHIQFLDSPVVDGASIFENDLGIVAPGVHVDDSVLAPGATRIIYPATMIVD